MSDFLLFIKSKRYALLSLVIAYVIFAAAFFLFRLSFFVFFYSLIVSLIIISGIFVIDFISTKKRLAEIRKIKSFVPEDYFEMPPYDSAEEKELIKIIALLEEEKAKIRMLSSKRISETIEYYTLWVHQIKTPIASMKLALENEDTPLSRRLSLDLSRIEQYVDMVMAYVRLESDENDLVFCECSLDDIIKRNLRKLSASFIDKKLALEYTPSNLRIVTDEKWLSLVIEQILTNSLKYTNEGKISISVSDDSVLCIKDTGIGIKESDLPRIFEKGFTGVNGRVMRSSSGIGLYLCKKICRLLSYDIRVESKEQLGTKVFIDLKKNDGIKE